jgi:hypothetical protein
VNGSWIVRYALPGFLAGLIAGFAAVTFIPARRHEPAAVSGEALHFVHDVLNLRSVRIPGFLSPCRMVSSTEHFSEAPIRIVAWMDFLCPDCVYLYHQLERLRPEFGDSMNVVCQFFPLEADCNEVVAKDLHPGACELARIAFHDPEQFETIQREIWTHPGEARDPAWRAELAHRFGVEDALTDFGSGELLRLLILTGKEYPKNHERWEYGIRSTPTMIVNNRLLIGTFPDDHLRALFRALLAGDNLLDASGEEGFIENWVPRH